VSPNVRKTQEPEERGGNHQKKNPQTGSRHGVYCRENIARRKHPESSQEENILLSRDGASGLERRSTPPKEKKKMEQNLRD